MTNSSGSVAIVGMSGAFPGAQNIEQFWERLREGTELISQHSSTASRGMQSQRRQFVPAVACMDGVDLFDAAFFGLTPAEAEITDPQHRILLEHAWNAMEHAGYDPGNYDGSIGVFAGCTTNSYLVNNIGSRPDLLQGLDPVQLNVGNGTDFLTTRISYKLNLRGPSHAVQSACSTSLVAVHCACRSLLDFECDMALAGGVSVNVTVLDGYWYREGGMLSPDGHCRAFDAEASGTVFGNGVGVVLLKRLEDAMADRDFIHAVILGSAVNNDGSNKVGYLAPAVNGQAAVIAEAFGSAGVEPESVGYVECHGTGTSLGDPVEIRALTKVFGSRSEKFCAIGSVKTNVGHLDAAAGVTGLIKAVMSLRTATLVPTLHFQRANPFLGLEETPFHVPTDLQRWVRRAGPLRAGVSAFGVGGTNAHVVLEEPPPKTRSEVGQCWQLLIVSAKTRTALRRAAENLADLLLRPPDGAELADIAYTLQVGRRAFPVRVSVVCRTPEEGAALLLNACNQAPEEQEESAPPVAFLFPGEVAHFASRARYLYQHEPVFRAHFVRCSEIAQSSRLSSVPLINAPDLPELEAEPDARAVRLLMLLSFEYALAQLWISWGVKPQALIGEGAGKYCAACLSGDMTIEDMLRSHNIKASGEEHRMSSQAEFEGGRSEIELHRTLASPGAVLLEIGAGGTMQALALRESGSQRARVLISSFPSAPIVEGAERRPLLEALGTLWQSGVAVEWKAFHAAQKRFRCPLPTYPFERQRYWIDRLPANSQNAVQAASMHQTSGLPAPPPRQTRPKLRNPYVPPQDETERSIVAILERQLGVYPVGVTDKFGELGGDSLAGLQVVTEINAALGCEFRTVDLYEGLTPRALAARIAEHRAPALTPPTNGSEAIENQRPRRRDDLRRIRRGLDQASGQ